MLKHIQPYLQKKILAIFLSSFASGLTLILVTGTLATYLTQSHASIKTISLFSLCTLPYAIKYLFTPFIRINRIPYLSQRYGNNRAWILMALFVIFLMTLWMGSISLTSPNAFIHLFIVTLFTVIFSAINDTALAEYQIELLTKQDFGHGMASYSMGFRLGMITGGSVALYIAAIVNWHAAYYLMATFILIGIVAVIFQPSAKKNDSLPHKYFSFQEIMLPIKNLLSQSKSFWIILLILCFNFSDNMLTMMINPFLLKTGFKLSEIGFWQGNVGGILSIAGGFVGGILLSRYHLFYVLALSMLLLSSNNALLILLASEKIQTLTSMNLIFHIQSMVGNLTTGISAAAYVALISSQCKSPYIASHNALLTSLTALAKIIFIIMSGYLITKFGWLNCFIFITLFSLPIFGLIYYCMGNNSTSPSIIS